MAKKIRSLTGLRATGAQHIGNYLASIKPAIEVQNSREGIYFIADLHSLTDLKDRELLRRNTLSLAALWLAAGLDVETQIFFRQSDVPIVAEVAWYLASVTGFGLLEKAHAYKDAVANGRDATVALFYYPVLMAADILLYQPDEVPVGKDQIQHVEMARDMALSFNAAVQKEIFKLPKAKVDENRMIIPGLDGRKMSKSYNNTIAICAERNEIKKLVASIATDSSKIEEPKKLESTIIGELFRVIATPEKFEDLKVRLAKGGVGWGHAKEELVEALESFIAPIRTRYNELISKPDYLYGILESGRDRAKALAAPTLSLLRETFGFSPSKI
ncbi:MAG TPA: tryptophan--tRNA ligase [Oligoflexia bacterium]|nr:tryptophan--tRNA ligase [Oligoflexia bacterium]HMP27444.1 tryptophan--tRNA ligase [Oligoflexia bacterium]